MRNDKLIPGMILVIIGALFLLHNFGYFYFHWENLWRMWPVFLVIAGVNLLFAHNTSPWASILKITVLVGGFALILFGNFGGGYRWWHHPFTYSSVNSSNDDNNGNDNYDDDGDDDNNNNGKTIQISGSKVFKEPFNAAVKIARLNISGGATKFRLNDTTNQLFKATTKSFHGSYQFDHHNEDSVYVMNFSMKDNKVWNWHDGDANEADISLNTLPVWEMNIEAGATDLNFDLSKYKIRTLKLDGGAGAFVIKMGQPLEATNVDVSSSATDVTVIVPKGAACHINSDTGLSSNTFDNEFAKIDDDNYETANFAAAKNKIYIHISGIAGDFKVHTY